MWTHVNLHSLKFLPLLRLHLSLAHPFLLQKLNKHNFTVRIFISQGLSVHSPGSLHCGFVRSPQHHSPASGFPCPGTALTAEFKSNLMLRLPPFSSKLLTQVQNKPFLENAQAWSKLTKKKGAFSCSVVLQSIRALRWVICAPGSLLF